MDASQQRATYVTNYDDAKLEHKNKNTVVKIFKNLNTLIVREEFGPVGPDPDFQARSVVHYR